MGELHKFHRQNEHRVHNFYTGGKKAEGAQLKRAQWMENRRVLQVVRLLHKLESGGLDSEEAEYLLRNIDRVGVTQTVQSRDRTK